MLKATTADAYDLIHQGTLALSAVEAAGIRIDVDYLHRAIKKATNQIKKLETALQETDVFKAWQKRFGTSTKLGSRSQLGTVFFEVLGYNRSESNKSNDEKAFIHIDHSFIKDYFTIEKLKKAKQTYLEGILRECVDGYLHAFYNLNIARSYRSTSDNPNFQNMPVRNELMSRLIRQCFIARKDHQLVEIDFSGIEVCGAACYNKDPVLIEYICDKTKDMHRDMAAQCFMLPTKQVAKKTRYAAKNMYVFPEFYGSYYVDCSRNLWEAIDNLQLKTEKDGIPLYDWLRSKGIKKLGKCDPKARPVPGTFEHHIQAVEKDFWERRFKVYADWKRRWYNRYLQEGGFNLLTGFRINGVYRRNEVINLPIQGTSFHFLLWCLIQLNRELRKRKMKSVIVGQIHDSIVADVHEDELDDYLVLVKQIMTVDLPHHWKWINVPLSVEAEVSPPGGSWYDKEKVEL